MQLVSDSTLPIHNVDSNTLTPTSRLKQYMDANRYSDNTKGSYITYIKKLLEWGSPITDETIEKYCLRYSHGQARAALKLYMRVNKLKHKLPPYRVRHTTTMNDLGGYMTIQQIQNMLSFARCKRNFILFLTMFRSGRRISEMLPLKVKHINFEDGLILFSILKKRREFLRYKAIDNETIGLLKDYIKSNKLGADDYLFLSKASKKPITRQDAHYIFRQMCKDAGIHYIGTQKPHTHILRHSHAINFLKNVNHPAALKILQQQLEHSNIGATSIYLQFSQKDQRDMLNRAFVTQQVTASN